MQCFVKIGWSAAKLLRIFDFQNGGRPPSWIWYTVIADHPWLVFDGPNILIKLHIDRVYTLQDIAIFIRPVWLQIAYSRPLLGILPPNEFQFCRKPQQDRPLAKTRRMSHKPWKSVHGFDLGACPRKKCSITIAKRQKSHKTNISPIWEEAPAERIGIKICTIVYCLYIV